MASENSEAFYNVSWLHVEQRKFPSVMAIPVVEFSRDGYKIRKIFG
jgi:hypothetical protein